MKLLEESEANRLTEKELRKIAEQHYKRRIPYRIKRNGLVALVTGTLNETEKAKVFRGLQPDEFNYHEVRQFPRKKLKEMIKAKYGFRFPETVHRSYMEKIIEGKLKVSQLPDSVKYEIGKKNQSQGAVLLKQFGLDKLPGLKTLRRKSDMRTGKRISGRLFDRKYTKSKYK